jgi:acid phosphatase (class A)
MFNNMKAKFANPLNHSVVRAATFVAFLFLCGVARVQADESYLRPGQPDGITLLAPPPEPDSPEQAADLQLSRDVAHKRVPADIARAKVTGTLSFTLFAPAIGPVFQLDKLPRTRALLEHVRHDIHNAIYAPKIYWKRPRPYQVDTNLFTGFTETSPSYPSGHSACGTIYAEVLAEIFPEKKDAILAVGREIGWDRVVIGMHFLTDVRAGRVLGQAIVGEMMESPEFQRDLAAAKAEAQSAH